MTNLKKISEKLIQFFFNLKFIRRFRLNKRCLSSLKINIPNCNCVDIGASYFFHWPWNYFLKSANTTYFAVDPLDKNLKYTENWNYPSKIKTIKSAIGSKNQEATLNITNVNSGSSTLKIEFTKKNIFRTVEKDFKVLKEEKIKLESINDFFKNNNILIDKPILLKVDTQGSEYEIIKEIDEEILDKIMILEVESSLEKYQIYKNSTRFDQIYSYMLNKQFELLELKVHNFDYNEKTSLNQAASHCDSVFIKDFCDRESSLEEMIILLVYFLDRNYLNESRRLIKNNSYLKEYLKKDNKKILKLLSIE